MRHIAFLSLLNYCQNSLTIIRTSCWFSIHADFMLKFWYESVHSLWIFNIGRLLKCIYFNKNGTYTTCVFALLKIKWNVCKMNDFENCTSLAWHQQMICTYLAIVMYHLLRFSFRMQYNYRIVLNDKIDWFQYSKTNIIMYKYFQLSVVFSYFIGYANLWNSVLAYLYEING